MDLRRLRYFLVLAEELNFTRAAHRLHIAQPALSQQIRALEREIGAQLLERGGRSCRLTVVGEVVAREAGELLAHAAASQERIRAAVGGRQGQLRLALTRSARGGPVDALLAAFRTLHPDVDLVVRTGWTAHNITELLAGRLDAAFVRPPLDGEALECRHIAREELLVAVPAGHPLARERRVTRARIAAEPVILWPRENAPGMHDLITRQLWPDGARIVREEPDDEQLLLSVAAGTGIAPVPEGRARALRIPGVRLKHVTAPMPTVDLALAHRPASIAPALRGLLGLIDTLPGATAD
ncbi:MULTISPECIES: LysR family transcriptional regulator [unclassified Streptomyces]|uniref:LysR family transcriptional regulator n=1 Tax=unclassified Streptomyces TaxID=2593676 RepID=UPI002257A0CD|nr:MULTISPECIES: LysR substrate-binding domain-containing protein [unclassified Streptomyces]MCX5337513.1 LysR substrate-binding domain-containing protein [Streptomyces sp. NBC_00140]MCX5365536.1 LysR substrate-binding domain-containing protein [Streptomyces sp. NBC_00124]